MTTLKIACVQYKPRHLSGLKALELKLDSVMSAAVQSGARLVLMPEYAGMELASLLPGPQAGDLAASIAGIQDVLSDYLELNAELARRHDVTLVSGSLPVRIDGEFRNRVHVFTPKGLAGIQDKLVMTRFEREQWGIAGGRGITLFDAPFGRFAVAVCYDVEFPAITAAMSRAGAQMVLVPSCTDTLAGFYRVRSCARARAVENQLYVAQAPTVGNCDWSPALDVNTGRAGVFTPCDTGFPDDGVLAEGTAETVQVVVAELDFALIDRVREGGQVLNFKHQQEVGDAAGFTLDTVTLP